MNLFDSTISFVMLLAACGISGYFTYTYGLNTTCELSIVAVSYFVLLYLAISAKCKYDISKVKGNL